MANSRESGFKSLQLLRRTLERTKSVGLLLESYCILVFFIG